MPIDSEQADVQFPEVDGPGPGAEEVDVETLRELVVAQDLAREVGAGSIPLPDEKTGELFVVRVRDLTKLAAA